MSGLLLIYAVVISIELVLSLVLLVTLYLVVAPIGRVDDEPPSAAARRPRDLATTPRGALRDAFDTLARGEDDLARLTHARTMLARYAASQPGPPEGNEGT